MNLKERLRARIQREGPISFYEWMKAALYDEREGYYCRRDRVRQGRRGDYRTAPEMSPLFAATFAGYFVKLFRELGSPNRFTVIEFGAGSGEFAHGVLTTLRAEHPEVFDATNYLIEEVGDSSRAQCEARLAEFSERVTHESPRIKDGNIAEPSLADVRAYDKGIGIIFSNELIDAFPVNRVVMRDGRLRQLQVGLNEDEFIWVEGDLDQPVADYCERIGVTLAEGQMFEVNLDAEDFLSRAAALLARGHVVTVDYGAAREDLLSDPNRQKGTLRGFRRHQFADEELSKPGERDLTTTVDWTQMTEAGARAGLRTVRFERLDQFLIAEGLLECLNRETHARTSAAAALRLTTSARELILPTGMAASFQVLVQEKAH